MSPTLPNGTTSKKAPSKPSKAKKAKKAKSFYSDEDSSSSSSSSESDSDKDDKNTTNNVADDENNKPEPPPMDEDHRLLLKQCAQLLHSTNSGVILAVTTLYWNLAPREEMIRCIRPLVRLARNKRAISYVLLANIATMCTKRPELFRPYIKDFYINSTDAAYVKEIKLDLLANCATDVTMPLLLKEFHAYTKDPDKEFVSRTIAAIARCAQRMPDIAERCVRGLMSLADTSSSESVVAQSVVAIRQLLQSNPKLQGVVIKSMARLLDRITIPQARTAIVWIIGEYQSKIPKLAPDCLRKLAITFRDEDDSVKAQVLNLAVKLFLSNPKQTSLLFKYVMDLCKYDVNYDLRDRARLMRALFFKKKVAANGDAGAATSPSSMDTAGKDNNEVKDVFKGVLLTEKPAPRILAPFIGRDRYVLGSLSHTLNQAVTGHVDLPPFPDVAPDPSTRKPKVPAYMETEVDGATRTGKRSSRHKKRSKKHSDSESGSDQSGSSDSDIDSDASQSERSVS